METNINNPGKAAMVRAMFAEIAPRYDLLNHALSFNVDRHWRKFTVRKLEDVLKRPGARSLDLCCGTGDLSLELGARAETIGLDFCHPMLKLAMSKVGASIASVEIIEGDALRVPLPDAAFDVVTIGFGLRNLESIDGGLREIFRLLKRGGRAAVLEFSRPRARAFRGLFDFYFTRVLPRIGNAVSGSGFAYDYLPDSVKDFPDQEALATMMRTIGFSNVRYYNLFGGVAALHMGDKP
ncbi:MAG: bifunctional demethylmenaquinone methyltransferase/2-methoxy-6-polyprenyl-1,4-benzoquinol methylase UbiE [Blastocatellia bacterium]|nr:bifunctional demethylmenaquinone methyltransferase/2-methoxy-6-polyprenyl-1,4-benzoquinol methylase UbiE [Blastocatellia bacterium]